MATFSPKPIQLGVTCEVDDVDAAALRIVRRVEQLYDFWLGLFLWHWG